MPKGTPLEYFRLYETFFRKKIFIKGSPFNFLIFSDRMDVEKCQRAPFQFFRHCETFFQIFFHKRVPIHQYFDILKSVLLFLRLRYGADLGRSRLVSFSHTFKEFLLTISIAAPKPVVFPRERVISVLQWKQWKNWKLN